jgi:CubicO group peptidase (beta-lactamase class C family)
MNLQFIICFLLTTTFISGCNIQDKNRGVTEQYTAVNFLSEVQSKEVDQVVLYYLDDYEYISIGLIGSNGAVLIRSYGADRNGRTDVYASVSKPVTSMIFFQMLEDGLIASVNDPIGSYSKKYRDAMPDQYSDNPVTFEHLLSHRSGIPHHDRIWSKGKLQLQFEPGTATMYSTRGYGVLGDVLCEIAGMNYNQLVKEYIGKPVKAASFHASSFLFEAPGGLVKSTISDMVLFASGVLDDTYVSDSLKLNVQWVPTSEDPPGEIGLGWYLTNYGTDSLAVYHAGSNGRPRAFIALRPEQHLGVVILGKQYSSDGDQMFYLLARDLIQKLRMFEKPRSKDRILPVPTS